MIACFLSNISAKYYKNPSMLSRVIAKNVGDVFFETQCRCEVTGDGVFTLQRYGFVFARRFPWWESSMVVDLFCSCDLDLNPMTFIYELDPYSLEIYRMCKYELSASRLSKVIV